MAHLIYLNSYEMNLSDLSHSQICQRVRSVICEAVWEAMRVRARPHRFESPICEADRPLTHTGRCNAFSRGSDCIARCAWEADRPHRSDSQICEAMLGLPRPLTTKSCDLSESPSTASHAHSLSRPHTASHGLSRTQPLTASHGLTRPHRFESPIGLSRTPGDAVILGAAWLISRLNALPRSVESDRHLGLSQPPTSASHAQRPRVRSSGLSDWFHG